MSYNHGVRVLEVNTGSRSIATVSTAVIGLVAQGTDADVAVFPLNTPVLITDIQAAITKAGVSDTLCAALTAISDQASPFIVVVRTANVTTGETAVADTLANTIAGVKKLLLAEAITGMKPRIIGAPGLDATTVATELATTAGKLRAMAYVSANGGGDTTVADILDYRETFSAREVMLIDGNWMLGATPVTAVATALGLRAKIDQEQGWHKTLSNVAVQGVTGIQSPRTFDLQSSTTDVGALNEGDITGLVRMNGFRFWGSRTCSDEPLFQFESATRTAQIMADTMAEGVAWALDKPLHPSLARDIIENINAKIRQLVAGGYIIGGRAWIDASSNLQADLAGGKLKIDYDYTPCPPLEDLTLTQRITDSYLADFALQVSG